MPVRAKIKEINLLQHKPVQQQQDQIENYSMLLQHIYDLSYMHAALEHSLDSAATTYDELVQIWT